MKPIPGGYNNYLLRLIDNLSWILTIPWSHLASLCLSSIYFTTHDSRNIFFISLRFGVCFPILCMLTLLTTPIAIFGYLLRITLTTVKCRQPFLYYEAKRKKNLDGNGFCPDEITFLTSNVILCAEIFSRFNNNRSPYWRLKEIPYRLLKQNPNLNKKRNFLKSQITKDQTIIEEIPNVDILFLQEVCERIEGRILCRILGEIYPFILYDVTRHRFTDNCCLVGSGLFICSKYPILEADFHPFPYRTSFGKYLSYGILNIKVDLGVCVINGKKLRAVGYASNTHLQAFQGKDNVLESQLDVIKEKTKSFIKETWNMVEEVIKFSVLAGDFNFDNMSPGDANLQKHEIWSDFYDACAETSGKDYNWSIGTELRQLQLHTKEAQNPDLFKTILQDDIIRRKYILDANVIEQNMDLMTIPPQLEKDGTLAPKPWGGQRRVDKILIRNNFSFLYQEDQSRNETLDAFKSSEENIQTNHEDVMPIVNNERILKCTKESISTLTEQNIHKNRISSVWFSTAIAGLSDHIPYIVQINLNA